MTYAIRNKILLCVVTIAIVLCTVVFPVQSTFAYAAESGVSFDNTNVLDDLKSSTVNGQAFNVNNYPFNENGQLKVIDFVEYCYSYRANQRSNYGLYLYVYNPQGLNLSTDSKRNKVQMAVKYNSDGEATDYVKFDLQFCNKSTDSNYKNLFYKFKVADKKVNDTTFADRVNSNERRYDISGIELLTYGATNATDYAVNGTYKFIGFAEGYGPDANAKSTLVCNTQFLETIELEVKHTFYRTAILLSVVAVSFTADSISGILVSMPLANIFIMFGIHSSAVLPGPFFVGEWKPKKSFIFCPTLLMESPTHSMAELIPSTIHLIKFLPQLKASLNKLPNQSPILPKIPVIASHMFTAPFFIPSQSETNQSPTFPQTSFVTATNQRQSS